MGKWKETVSRKQSKRKNMYCRIIGWEARNEDSKGGVAVPPWKDDDELEAVAALSGTGWSVGGESAGRGSEPLNPGVALSIRAQVR